MSFDKLERIRQIASAPLPQGLAQTLPGKGNAMYLPVQTVIDMLNVAFGDSWSVEYSEPVVESFSQGKTVVRVKARITVHVTDPETGERIAIVREGFGADTMNRNGEENVTKSAQSDALKKAASTFGIDAQLRRKGVEVQYYYSLHSEPMHLSWTNERVSAFGEEWKTINSISKKYNLSQGLLNAYVERLTRGKDKCIAPDNIVAFVSWLKDAFPLTTTQKSDEDVKGNVEEEN